VEPSEPNRKLTNKMTKDNGEKQLSNSRRQCTILWLYKKEKVPMIRRVIMLRWLSTMKCYHLANKNESVETPSVLGLQKKAVPADSKFRTVLVTRWMYRYRNLTKSLTQEAFDVGGGLTLGCVMCPVSCVNLHAGRLSCRALSSNGFLKPVHTVAEKWDCRRCLAVFCDSLTFLRQCGQGFRMLDHNDPLPLLR